jgi:PAS domain S-box-containing protein
MVIRPKGDQPHFFAIGQTTRARVWTPDEQRLFQEIGRRLADGLTSLKILHDLRASERALRVSEARFRIFADQASDLFFLHDDQGTIVDVNRQACDSLGYTRDELLGMSAEQLEGDVDHRRYGGTGVTHDVGEVVALETRLRRKDGTMFPVEARGRWFTEGGRRLMLYLVRDIRERKQLEAELLQSQKMEAIGRLAGGIAHDFNNLLTVIAGYSDFIGEASAPDDERRRDAEEIRRAADRAALLTQQLLAFSRKQALHPTVVDVNVIVEETSRMLRRLIGEDVTLELRPAPAAVPVLIDAGQLQQVLMNLAVNARDAMPTGGRLTIETGQIRVEREEPAQPTPLAPGAYMRVAITDTGEGMAPEVLARAFEPFFTTKGVGKGTGLGLSTVYGIVSQSRAHLRVDSTPARGTTFEIFLPAVERGRFADDTMMVTTLPTARGAETILLVEDEDMVRRLAEQSLVRAGYHVLVADGATEALRIARAHEGTIDLVVTDVVMPELPGPELVARLEAVRPGVPVLYVSGYADDTVMRYGLPEERVSFLAKPFTPDSLSRRVREVLDGKD